jgi:ribosome-associated translation inhibitor RaiA
MQIPLQITFRHMKPSEAVADAIRDRAEKLEHFYDRITGCHVIVESPNRPHHQGNLFHVRIDLTVPGAEIVVGRDPPEHHAHEDVYVAVRDAFDAARRQIEDFIRQSRPREKSSTSICRRREWSNSFSEKATAFSKRKTDGGSTFTGTAS